MTEEFAIKLEKTSVDTLKELVTRNSNNLFEKLITDHPELKDVIILDQIKEWINIAKGLDKIIEY